MKRLFVLFAVLLVLFGCSNRKLIRYQEELIEKANMEFVGFWCRADIIDGHWMGFTEDFKYYIGKGLDTLAGGAWYAKTDSNFIAIMVVNKNNEMEEYVGYYKFKDDMLAMELYDKQYKLTYFYKRCNKEDIKNKSEYYLRI